jgi:6-phosphogluconolactonase
MKIIVDTKININKKVVDLIENKIKSIKKEFISIGLCGGNSVSEIYSELSKRDINWKNIHIFLTDERISKDKKELNISLINEHLANGLLNNKKIRKENIHSFSFSDNIKKDLFNYNMDLSRISYRFDIVLLSSGEDGHVASLFPHHSSIENSSTGYIHVNNSPKLPIERVSASRSLIMESDTCILLFLGETKRQALKKFKDKKIGYKECPAKIVENIKDCNVFSDN